MNSEPKTNRGWRIGRRIVIGMAIFATLVAIFYTIEDWRGKRAWEKTKHELEAKGEVLDWNKYIPPPVPDDQNFFTANSNILLHFKKAQSWAEGSTSINSNKWLQLSPTFPTNIIFTPPKTGLVVAKLMISPSPGENLVVPPGYRLIKLTDPAAGEKVREIVQATMGHTIQGAAGFQFSGRSVANLEPTPIVVQADTTPLLADLQNLVASGTVTNIGRLQVTATPDKTVFEIRLTDVQLIAAADYLAWSDQLNPAFDQIREALKRPYAVLPGDYSRPFMVPIINFISMRFIAQTLAQRAQCNFLLGRPDRALPDVLFINDICKILENAPTHQPMTLVGAMIHVAIVGLYANTVAEGLRMGAWQEPQLKELQAQLTGIDVLPEVKRAFEAERAGVCLHFETLSRQELLREQKMRIEWGMKVDPFWKNPEDLFFTFAPRGWRYQNMVVHASLLQNIVDSYDITNHLIRVAEANRAGDDWNRKAEKRSPYTFLNSLAVPNFIKATQTTAHNQAQVGEAQIACALERYHFAHGDYPETLEALVPQFIEKLPHDIIGGGPFRYERRGNGRFILYSIGWNEKDDGGVDFSEIKNASQYAEGDWVWKVR